MYLVPVEIRKSSIHGTGVFARSDIKKHTIVWRYTEGHDKKLTTEEFGKLDEDIKAALLKIAYLSPTSGKWVVPPEDDPACYTNHDPVSFNISVIIDEQISEEPIFVANRDISEGEEITNNYLEFDENSKVKKLEWLWS